MPILTCPSCPIFYFNLTLPAKCRGCGGPLVEWQPTGEEPAPSPAEPADNEDGEAG